MFSFLDSFMYKFHISFFFLYLCMMNVVCIIVIYLRACACREGSNSLSCSSYTFMCVRVGREIIHCHVADLEYSQFTSYTLIFLMMKNSCRRFMKSLLFKLELTRSSWTYQWLYPTHSQILIYCRNSNKRVISRMLSMEGLD